MTVGNSDFPMERGVRHGFVMGPSLFNLVFNEIIKTAVRSISKALNFKSKDLHMQMTSVSMTLALIESVQTRIY